MAAGVRKKYIGMIAALSMIFLCGCGSHTVSEQTEQVTYKPEDSSVTYAVQTEEHGYPVQIPSFASVHESSAIGEINQEIEDLLTALYKKDQDSEVTHPQIVTEVYENDRYLQAVSRYVEYPLVGGYGDVASFNYDRIHDKKLTLTDALVMKQTTLDDVRQMVTDSALNQKEPAEKEISIYGVTVDGFSLDENDQCTFYGNADLCLDGSTQWSYIYEFQYDTQTLKIYDLEK